MHFDNVKLSRKYLIKRVVAKLIVIFMRVEFLRDNLIKFSLIEPEYADVEGIFYKLDVEREIENIHIINDLISRSVVSQYIDIGSNFGQFAKGIALDARKKILVEPNPFLWNYILSSNPGSTLMKFGLVHQGEGKINFMVVPGNTGACRVVDSDACLDDDSEYMLVDVISTKKFVNEVGVRKFENSFIKIDIEGSELKIIKSFVESLPESISPIYAFETLCSSNVREAILLLPGYNFYESRFEYQGTADRNYRSILSLAKVFLNGKDHLNLLPLSNESISREFYSLVFCIPISMDPYSNNK